MEFFCAEAVIKEAQAFLAHTLPLMAQHDMAMAAACLRTAADIALDSVGKVRRNCKRLRHTASRWCLWPSLLPKAYGKSLPWTSTPGARAQPCEQVYSFVEGVHGLGEMACTALKRPPILQYINTYVSMFESMQKEYQAAATQAVCIAEATSQNPWQLDGLVTARKLLKSRYLICRRSKQTQQTAAWQLLMPERLQS